MSVQVCSVVWVWRVIQLCVRVIKSKDYVHLKISLSTLVYSDCWNSVVSDIALALRWWRTSVSDAVRLFELPLDRSDSRLYIACTTHTIALLTCLHYLTCDSKLTICILRYVINGLVLVLIYGPEFEAEYTTYLSALAALFAHYLWFKLRLFYVMCYLTFKHNSDIAQRPIHSM